MNARDRKKLVAQAKTIVGRWFDSTGDEPRYRAGLLRGLDQFFEEIDKRDHRTEARTELLGDGTAPCFAASTKRARFTPTRKGLAVTTVVPDWAKGLGQVIDDEAAEFNLSWFAHYARQYIHRSEVAKGLMIAWERDQKAMHVFGSEGRYQFDGGIRPATTLRAALSSGDDYAYQQWGIPQPPSKISRSRWLKRNTLDPAIHQGIFHFLRGQQLLAAEFDVEAVLAFDCVIQALQTLNWSTSVAKGNTSRPELFHHLRLGTPSIELADQIQFIRNHFAAHAGGWRWWDAGEQWDSEFLPSAANLASRMLRRAADLEPLHRTIDPDPPRWADWLLENFPVIWRTVWFR